MGGRRARPVPDAGAKRRAQRAAGAGAPRHGALLRANRRLRGGRVAATTGARPVQGFLRTVADRRADTRSERQTGRRTRSPRTLQGLTAGRNPGQVSGSAGARHRTAETTLACNGLRHLRSQTPALGEWPGAWHRRSMQGVIRARCLAPQVPDTVRLTRPRHATVSGTFGARPLICDPLATAPLWTAYRPVSKKRPSRC